MRVCVSISFTTNTGLRFSVQNGSTITFVFAFILDSFFFNPSPFSMRTMNYGLSQWTIYCYIAPLFRDIHS